MYDEEGEETKSQSKAVKKIWCLDCISEDQKGIFVDDPVTAPLEDVWKDCANETDNLVLEYAVAVQNELPQELKDAIVQLSGKPYMAVFQLETPVSEKVPKSPTTSRKKVVIEEVARECRFTHGVGTDFDASQYHEETSRYYFLTPEKRKSEEEKKKRKYADVKCMIETCAATPVPAEICQKNPWHICTEFHLNKCDCLGVLCHNCYVLQVNQSSSSGRRVRRQL